MLHCYFIPFISFEVMGAPAEPWKVAISHAQHKEFTDGTGTDLAPILQLISK